MVWKSKPQASAVLRQSSRSGQVMRCIDGGYLLRDELRLNLHRAMAPCLSMIFLALAAAMCVAAVTMPMEVVQGAAEAALDGAAEGLAVGARNGRQAWAAVGSWHKAHRYGADGRVSHQGQDDAA
jgi:hypothetical protein